MRIKYFLIYIVLHFINCTPASQHHTKIDVTSFFYSSEKHLKSEDFTIIHDSTTDMSHNNNDILSNTIKKWNSIKDSIGPFSPIPFVYMKYSCKDSNYILKIDKNDTASVLLQDTNESVIKKITLTSTKSGLIELSIRKIFLDIEKGTYNVYFIRKNVTHYFKGKIIID